MNLNAKLGSLDMKCGIPAKVLVNARNIKGRPL
jgi:hypothetical protein